MNIEQQFKNKQNTYYRSFFWRKYQTPYKILIAEFMLQRTKADQVEPVYKKFLQQYPDINSLSKAKLKSVEKYTSTLGLHWRASNFINAATFIVKNLNGMFPETRKELIEIPGVGDYVGGAISAVCFNKADYVIDSNIARLINRYNNLQLTGEIRRKKIIIERAKKLFKVKDQKTFLFAILDFTALVCKPIKPLCAECPIKKGCKYSNKTITPT
jgi:A/G-specific adenine glycosylase